MLFDPLTSNFMPELPEVEITKLGLEPLIVNQTIECVYLHRANLRWDIPKHLLTTLPKQKVNAIQRRGKYLLLMFDVGTLIMHLGMSGSIRVVDKDTPLKKHDHFELLFSHGKRLRLNDPRRFGAVLFSKDGKHPLLDNLGVEPLSDTFDEQYLYVCSRKKQQNIKAFIMDSKIVVGVGNIYACESLHQAGVNPKCKASSVSKKRYEVLTQCIKQILLRSIASGGTTLQDFSSVDGKPGYFSQTLSVYGRENEICTQCGSKITRIVQSQRSTFYCKHCQT